MYNSDFLVYIARQVNIITLVKGASPRTGKYIFMNKFAKLGLRAAILRAVEEGGYVEMTPIQAQAIPRILDGKDLVAVAQTGTGKTAAFSLPLIQMLLKGEGKRSGKAARSLILAPP